MSFTRIRPIWRATILGGVLGLAACAQGASDPDPTGDAPKKNVDTTEPEPPSVKVPGKTPDEDPPADDDAGQATSDAGSTTTDSGTTPVDAGKVDSGVAVDAGACAKTAPSNLCGLAPQCGCAANETCDITNKATGAVSCTLAGGGPLASLCTTSSQCAKGLACAYGACRPYCAAINTACSGMAGVGMCTELYDPPGTLVPNGKVCTITCDLRNPSAVCGSNNCIYDGSVKATDCDKSGTKDLYDACSSYNDCKQGMACVNNPFFGPECEKWCRIGQSDCGFLETCEDVYGANAPTSGGVKLGHCQ